MRCSLLVLIFLFSCGEGTKTLPSSTGENSEVIFVVNDALWELEIDTLVRNTFGAAIQGMSQNETMFNVVQINHSEFKSIFKTHKNIVIITQGKKIASHKNKWASGQFVAHLGWEENPGKLVENLKRIRDIFVLKEISSIRKSFRNLSQKKAENTVKLNFKIDCIVPNEYKVIKNNQSVFWANYNPQQSDEIKNILIFSFIPNSVNLQEQVLQKTDSIFAKYLLGKKEGSYVKIEKEYLPYYFENTYRGLWKLENGFMGGPFLIKTYFVEEKIVVNVGLIFAPHSIKRKYIKELEAIL
tara:strand:- start:3269 stop:4162 length:894 start_codon:yes stop_codon:yes gene_type:complete